MTEEAMPPGGRAWLRAVERQLGFVAPADRLEIVEGLRAHILDALDGGDSITDILTRLGTPASVAAQATADVAPTITRAEQPARYLSARRVLQFGALGLTIAATCIIGLMPSYTATSIGEGGEVITSTSNGFQNVSNLSPLFVTGAVFALLLTIAPLVVRNGRLTKLTIVWAGLLLAVALVSIALINNWTLLPAAAASIFAALLPQPKRQPRPRLNSANA